MTCQHTSTLGVYLLGALEPEDRSSFESHLYGCDVCRAELVRLAPLPGLLNQITVADFEETVEPSTSTAEPVSEQAAEPELPEPVLLDVSAEPGELGKPAETDEPAQLGEPAEPDEPAEPAARARLRPRRRWMVAAAAAAAAVVLAVAGVLGYQTLQSAGGPGPHSVMWTAVDPISGVRANVRLTERAWGTDIKVWMSDVPGGKECRLVVMAREGYRDKPGAYVEVAGWWTSDHKPNDDIPGSTSIDLASINRLEIMDGNNMLVGLNPTRG